METPDEKELQAWREANWPKEGDKLFGPGKDPKTIALLEQWGHGFSLYADGYKKAADIVVEKVAETGSDQDYLLYPVCFLYRHYVELRLKELIDLGRRLFSSSNGFPETHKIDSLWSECRPLLEKAFPEGDKSDLDVIQTCIQEFASVDPKSESFRYPKDKQGKPTLEGLKAIDLKNLSEVMNRLAGLLAASVYSMLEMIQLESEVLSYYGPDLDYYA